MISVNKTFFDLLLPLDINIINQLKDTLLTLFIWTATIDIKLKFNTKIIYIHIYI